MPLAQVNDAMARLQAGSVIGRIVLTVSEEEGGGAGGDDREEDEEEAPYIDKSAGNTNN